MKYKWIHKVKRKDTNTGSKCLLVVSYMIKAASCCCWCFFRLLYSKFIFFFLAENTGKGDEVGKKAHLILPAYKNKTPFCLLNIWFLIFGRSLFSVQFHLPFECQSILASFSPGLHNFKYFTQQTALLLILFFKRYFLKSRGKAAHPS